MLKLFDKLRAKLSGDISVLVFSLFLAFFMWSMQRLTLEYSWLFEYKVHLNADLMGRSNKALSHNALIVRGKTSGFYILQHRVRKWMGRDAVYMTVDPKYLHGGRGNDLFAIAGEDLRPFVQESLGADFRLEGIASDSLYFTFPRQSYKKVPVVPVWDITYEPQFTTTLPATIRPDSVLIYGESQRIIQIDSVFTKQIRRRGAKASIQGVIQLQGINGIRFSDEDIFYSVDVQRYYEGVHSVRVTILNEPIESRFVFYPREVDVTYRALYHRKNLNFSDLRITADFLDLEQCGNKQIIKLRCDSQPAGIFNVAIEPKYIECFTN